MDELVREYLWKKGFRSAAEEMDKVLEPPSDIQNVTKRVAVNNATSRYLKNEGEPGLTTEELVVWGLHGDASMYKSCYDLFRSWAYGSLDLVKNELISLCFPLFTISFMSLIRKGHGGAARQFWNCFADDHKDWFASELQALSMFTTGDQLSDANFLASYPFVQHAHRRKFKVCLSNMVVNLLTTFLSQNDLLLIAAMVNENITIEKSNLLLPSEEAVHAELEGYGAAGVAADIQKSQHSLTLGVPGYGAILFTEPQGGSTQHPPPDFRSDELYQKWLKTVLLRRAFALGSAGAIGESCSVSGDKRPRFQEQVASKVGNLALDHVTESSIIFATFTNVNDSMICLDIDNEVKQFAGGFRDSCVRVWQLGGGGGGGPEWEYSNVLPWKDAGGAEQRPHTHIDATAAHTRESTTVPFVHSPHGSSSSHMIELRGHSRPVYGISQNQVPEAKGHLPSLVVSSSTDESIRLWDVAKRQCVGKYNCLMPSWDVAFSPVDYYFASANMDRTVTVFSTDRMEPIRIMTDHTSDVTCCKWHQNASLIASGSDDKTARLWDVRSGGSVRVFTGSHSAISCVAVSPSGALLAAGTDSGVVLLWDIASSTQLAHLRGHDGPVHSVAFSKDGSAVASGGADCSVKLWEIQAVLSGVGGGSSNGGSGGGSSSNSNGLGDSSSMLKLQPAKCFYTKLSPVFFVDFYGTNAFLYAGGPFTPTV